MDKVEKAIDTRVSNCINNGRHYFEPVDKETSDIARESLNLPKGIPVWQCIFCKKFTSSM